MAVTRRELLVGLAAGAAGMAIPGALLNAAAAPALPRRKPNILIILSDDQGYEDLGCYNSPQIRTPHLDVLARQSVRCTDFYAASPVCSPTRAALLTGRYPLRTGLNEVLGASNRFDEGIRKSEVLLPALLKPAGYATGVFGKWHVGFAAGTRPTERGFDEFLGFPNGEIEYFKHTAKGKKDLFKGIDPIELEGYSTDLFADAAIDFISRHKDESWFCYLPFNAPHCAHDAQMRVQAPKKYMDMYPDAKEPRKGYCAGVTAMDDAIGRVLSKLDELKLADNTLVVFFSDNGGFGERGASNGNLRGEKNTISEGGIRVPCIVRWPGRIPAGTVCHEPLIAMDLFSLSLAAAGQTAPKDRKIDGLDPQATLAGQRPSPHEFLCWQHMKGARLQWAIRRGSYKLGNVRTKQASGEKVQGLYDLSTDVAEAQDLTAKKPDVVKELTALYEGWRKDVESSGA